MKRIFMERNISILLDEHFEEFIDTEVSSGRYSSTSEVIRSALRLLEDEKSKKDILIRALIEGEESGIVKGFDRKVNLEKLHSKYL